MFRPRLVSTRRLVAISSYLYISLKPQQYPPRGEDQRGDAAYGTLLREPRHALHARIAEALESQFAEVAESKPELLARRGADRLRCLWMLRVTRRRGGGGRVAQQKGWGENPDTI